jgi:hypothetical protein
LTLQVGDTRLPAKSTCPIVFTEGLLFCRVDRDSVHTQYCWYRMRVLHCRHWPRLPLLHRLPLLRRRWTRFPLRYLLTVEAEALREASRTQWSSPCGFPRGRPPFGHSRGPPLQMRRIVLLTQLPLPAWHKQVRQTVTCVTKCRFVADHPPAGRSQSIL